MKRKGIAIISALVITAGSVFGVAYADNVNSQKAQVNKAALEKSIVADVQTDNSSNNGSCHGSSGATGNLAEIMSNNGFKDAVTYMQTGDYEKMNEFMNNLSEEDYQKMIDLMKENGYGSMAQMMESIGREGMLRMHNSSGSMHSGSSGMMGGLRSDI